MELNNNNTYTIETSVIKIFINLIFQHQQYTLDKNNSKILIKGKISSLTISGNRNKIIFQNEIINLIINGSSNKINATHRKCYLSNVIFNGSNNRIEVKRNNQNIHNIQNGSNNKLYIKRHNRNIYLNNNSGNDNIRNFDGSNISINFNGNHGQISKIIKIYNVVI